MKLLCSGNPCKNNGTCDEHFDNYTCDCLPGFTGDQCQGKDQCLPLGNIIRFHQVWDVDCTVALYLFLFCFCVFPHNFKLFLHFLRLGKPLLQGEITATMSHVKTMDLVSTLKMDTSASVQKSLQEQDVKVNLTTHFYLVT